MAEMNKNDDDTLGLARIWESASNMMQEILAFIGEDGSGGSSGGGSSGSGSSSTPTPSSHDAHSFSFNDQESMKRALNEFIRDSKYFYHAIHWMEPLILSLIGFHLFTLTWILLVRKNQILLLSTMAFLGIYIFVILYYILFLFLLYYLLLLTSIVFTSEYGGAFIAIMVSTPILINLILIVIFMLRIVVNMMVTLKTKQIKAKLANEAQRVKGNLKKTPSKKKD
ncbi:hypothetical protein BC829DRAFT_391125 [Chytridium lagenaria]|nr:hypothetical protein BC829DRAFT_391125 [Chytridium lagenaria]